MSSISLRSFDIFIPVLIMPNLPADIEFFLTPIAGMFFARRIIRILYVFVMRISPLDFDSEDS